MNNPILFYTETKLVLKFPGWSRSQTQAVREMLICWTRKGDNTLIAEPIRLAYIEAKETLPKLEEDESVELFKMHLHQILKPIGGAEVPGLFEVQKQPTRMLFDRDKALLTAAPGLGKTIMLCAAASRVQPQALVIVCPSSLVDNWRIELEKWWLAEERIISARVKVDIWRQLPPQAPCWGKYDHYVVITTPDTVRILHKKKLLFPYLEEVEELPSLLILDESYLYKNRKAARSQAVEELATLFRKCWQDSGMPISKFNDDLFFQLKILYPATFRGYWKFVERYCLLEKSHWGTKIVGDRLPPEKLKEDLADILIECQYPEGIPDWQPQIVKCRMGDYQDKIYNDLKEKLIVEAEVLGLDTPLTVKNLISLTSRLLQVVSNTHLVNGDDCSCKEDMLLEMLAEKPVPSLVWVNYIRTAKELQLKLKKLPWIKSGILMGATPPAERQRLVEGFQEGKYNLLIMHPGVGKYGHTLTVARTAYYLERNFDREGFYQTLFRGRRITSEHPIELIYLIATYKDGRSTLDQLVHNLLVLSSKNAQILTAGELIGKL